MVKRLWTAWSIHPIRNDKQMKNILLCLFIVFSATIQAQKIKVASFAMIILFFTIIRICFF